MFRQYAKSVLYFLGSTHLGRVIGSPLRGKGAILCYHRVLPHVEMLSNQGPERNLAISDRYFEMHLEYLKNNQTVISMDEMLNHILSDSTKFYVSITFDDGYRDNLDYALPLLGKYVLPATIYIASRFPEGDCWMWWYELEKFVMENDHINFIYNDFSLKSPMYSYRQKHKCYLELKNFIINNHESVQLSFLAELTGTNKRQDYSDLMLNWDEIIKLNINPLITIGAHTHSHPNLKILTKLNVEDEIKKSTQLLEKHLGCTVNHFAFPYGSVNEAGQREFDILSQQKEIKTAVTTSFGFIEQGNTNSINRIPLGGFNSLNELQSKINGFVSLLKNEKQ